MIRARTSQFHSNLVNNNNVRNTTKCKTKKKGYFKYWNLFITPFIMLPDYWSRGVPGKRWIYNLIYRFSILLMLYLTLIIIFIFIFGSSRDLQQFFMFLNYDHPKNPDFYNPEKYGLEATVNFYVTVEDLDDSSLLNIGLWLVVPTSEIKSTPIFSHGNLTAANILRNTAFPIAMYFHGMRSNRIAPKKSYDVLRNHFLVIGVDTRGYGDTYPYVSPSEVGIASDTAQIYKWIRSKTNNDIYVWGHSFGTALCTRGVRRLKETYNMVPTGLILEAPFTTMRDLVDVGDFGKYWDNIKMMTNMLGYTHWPIIYYRTLRRTVKAQYKNDIIVYCRLTILEKIQFTFIGLFFSWLPWFDAIVQIPLEENGFHFKTTTNILHVDCPIMILHAEDDENLPCYLGEKVAEVARTKRKIPPQGNVTYHQFGPHGYKHTGITRDPNVPRYIDEFIGICKDQNKRRDY